MDIPSFGCRKKSRNYSLLRQTGGGVGGIESSVVEKYRPNFQGLLQRTGWELNMRRPREVCRRAGDMCSPEKKFSLEALAEKR